MVGALGVHGANVVAKEPEHVYVVATVRDLVLVANIAKVSQHVRCNASVQTIVIVSKTLTHIFVRTWEMIYQMSMEVIVFVSDFFP